MVSRLFSSLSGFLYPSSPNEKRNDDAKNDNKLKGTTTKHPNAVAADNTTKHSNAVAANNNTAKTDATNKKTSQSVHRQPSSYSRKSDYDMQFINAESLDRAIVNRLQSKMNTSVADALEQQSSCSGIKLRCEEGIPSASSKLFQNENTTVNMPSHNEEYQNGDSRSATIGDRKTLFTAEAIQGERGLATETMFSTRFTELPRSRPQPAATLINESLSQSSVKSQSIPAVHSSAMHSFNKQLIGDINAGEPVEYLAKAQLEELFPDDRRSVMYRNSQFNLENSSREALSSNSSNVLSNTSIHSDTSLHFPMFGIPDLSSVPRRPSTTSSTETILGSVIKSTRQSAEHNTPRKSPRVRSISPPLRYSYLSPRISEAQIGNHFLDSTINDIIERGGDDFKTKYSSWIWDAFRTQLIKLKSLMITEFNEKIKSSLEEREQEITELQKRYRQKLVEFDSTTENFQQLMDNAYRDNQRMLKAKDFVIDKLKKEFLECKKHFEQDLQRQMQGYRAEAEVERMELQKRNDELMLIMLTDHSKCGLEESFKNEVESLHQLIKRLTAQNEELHQQLENSTSSASSLNKNAVENLEAQLDEATTEITDLRKMLQNAEREKEDLTVSYHQEIAKLNRKIQESSTRYDHQLRDAAEELEILRKKHVRDTKDLKQRIATQEAQYTATINEIRQQYGGQVESLSLAVSQLRNELTGGTRQSH